MIRKFFGYIRSLDWRRWDVRWSLWPCRFKSAGGRSKAEGVAPCVALSM